MLGFKAKNNLFWGRETHVSQYQDQSLWPSGRSLHSCTIIWVIPHWDRDVETGGINPKQIHTNLGNSSSTEKSTVCLNSSSWEASGLPINRLLCFHRLLVKENDQAASGYRRRGSSTHKAAYKRIVLGVQNVNLVLPPKLSDTGLVPVSYVSRSY